MAHLDAATEVMIGCLEALAPCERPLVVGEASGRLAAVLRAGGARPGIWLWSAVGAQGVIARAWPPDGPFDAAFVRLPKAKPALDFALHATASRLAPGAPIAVFGLNGEGVKSAAVRLAAVADEVTTLRTRQHARVIAGRRKATIPGFKASLADWRTVQDIDVAGQRVAWVSYPGVFAKGGLDAGTHLLIAHLPVVEPGALVLDFAAGSGVIARAVLDREPRAVVSLVDADALALEAARENVPAATALVGTGLEAAGSRPFDLIVSNPPLHLGVVESHAVLDHLIASAPKHLASGGRLILVVQRRVPVVPALEAAFGNAQVLADDGRFTVAAATRMSKRR